MHSKMHRMHHIKSPVLKLPANFPTICLDFRWMGPPGLSSKPFFPYHIAMLQYSLYKSSVKQTYTDMDFQHAMVTQNFSLYKYMINSRPAQKRW